jgi:hypothetical protein
MDKATIKSAIEGKKGANIYVSWTRPVKLLAKWKGFPLTKTTTMLVRVGCDYDEFGEVKEQRQTGELPATNAGLNGMVWDEFPLFIRGIKSGKVHLRMARSSFDNGKVDVEYRIDGQKVEKEDWLHTMQACEKAKKETPKVFNVNIEQITRINDLEVEEKAEEDIMIPCP